jgi:hypothetical protein
MELCYEWNINRRIDYEGRTDYFHHETAEPRRIRRQMAHIFPDLFPDMVDIEAFADTNEQFFISRRAPASSAAQHGGAAAASAADTGSDASEDIADEDEVDPETAARHLCASEKYLMNRQGLTKAGMITGEMNRDEKRVLEELIPGVLAHGGSMHMITKRIADEWERRVDAGNSGNLRRLNTVIVKSFLERRKRAANIKATMHPIQAAASALQARHREHVSIAAAASQSEGMLAAPSGGTSQFRYVAWYLARRIAIYSPTLFALLSFFD